MYSTKYELWWSPAAAEPGQSRTGGGFSTVIAARASIAGFRALLLAQGVTQDQLNAGSFEIASD